MNNDLESQAEGLLRNTIDRVLSESPPRLEGYFLEARVVEETRDYPSELQQPLRDVLGKWLLSNDEDKVNWALSLVYDLGATEHISTLKRLRWKILLGLAPVPRDWISSVDGVLKALRENNSR